MCRYRGSLAGERDSLESCYLRKQRTCNSKVATKVRNSHHYHHFCHCHHNYTLVIGRNTEIAKVVVATKGRCSIWFQWNLSLPKDECFFGPRLFMCSTFPDVFPNSLCDIWSNENNFIFRFLFIIIISLLSYLSVLFLVNVRLN